MNKKLSSKKIILWIGIPILVVFIVVGFVIGGIYKKKENINNSNVPPYTNSINYSYNRVYLLDKDDTLIPLTIKHQSFDTTGEEILYLVSMLKDDNSSYSDFKGVIPSKTTVKSLNLENDILSLDFDNNFTTYDANKELKLLESLVWTLTSLDYVNGIKLSVEGVNLNNMPVSNTPINGTLTKQIGINNYLLTSTIMGTGELVLSYYEKVINDKYYYVPVTHYVSNNDNLSVYDLTIQTLFKDPGLSSSLNVCRCIEDTSMLTGSVLTDNILYLSLSEDILFDEATVSYDVYMIMKEVTALLNDVKDVSFLMDLEEIMVNGVNKDETTIVSKIELNKYYI